jgi:hypothetical protein
MVNPCGDDDDDDENGSFVLMEREARIYRKLWG